MKATHQRQRQRDSRVRTFCRRRHLPKGAGVKEPDEGFLASLRTFDSGLEVVWHQLARRWVLYRVIPKAVPSEDIMIHEWTVQGPGGCYREVGDWVIRRLQRWDKVRRYGGDVKQANRRFVDDDEKRDRAMFEEKDDQEAQASLAAAEGAWFMARGRKSVVKTGDL